MVDDHGRRRMQRMMSVPCLGEPDVLRLHALVAAAWGFCALLLFSGSFGVARHGPVGALCFPDIARILT